MWTDQTWAWIGKILSVWVGLNVVMIGMIVWWFKGDNASPDSMKD